jgi:ketosteroid isomerase-like protein
MSRQNVEAVKRVYDLAAAAWRGDVDAEALGRVYHPDVVVEERPDFPDSDTYRGYGGLTRWWTAFRDIYDEVNLEPREFIPHGDRVVVRVHHVLRSKGGVELEQDFAHVFTVRDDRIIHMTGYPDVEDALRIVRGEGGLEVVDRRQGTSKEG